MEGKEVGGRRKGEGGEGEGGGERGRKGEKGGGKGGKNEARLLVPALQNKKETLQRMSQF